MPQEVTWLQIDLHGAHRANQGLQAKQTNLRFEIAQRLEGHAEKEQPITELQRVANMSQEVTRLQIEMHGAHHANAGLQAKQTNLRSKIAQRLERQAEKEQPITQLQRVVGQVAYGEGLLKKLLVDRGG